MKFTNEEILETVGMIAQDKLDIRTVPLVISLFDCSDHDPSACARKVREKILAKGATLRQTTWSILCNLDLSLAPPPAEGDSAGQVLETMA